ncbi:hypothetical protein [Falsiruegeria mediterranea]|uniref:Uncharacterized protein n=1 Tax=Falsiruegeria mediterranea M17 TaxID=1200281 RepID=A0A2R8C2Z9_9RHOB|nr:hypothetical protein [Falsiruegeria mediterranea]SPJ26811.1 hypothetical protein TRM7615_00280 [Falsiruegeria mediterranea M17]
MTTWTSKVALVGASLALTSACQPKSALSFAAAPSEQVTRVSLAAGNVQLVAPFGYCVDERSVKVRSTGSFAMLARCDTLGVRGFFSAQDLAVITVTTVGTDTTSQPTTKELAASAVPATVLDQQTHKGLPFLRLTSDAHEVDGASMEHWRSAFVVNGQLVGLALYANDGSLALTDEGAQVLSELASQTRKTSATKPQG